MQGLDKLYDGAQIMNEFAEEIKKGRKYLEESLIALKEIKREAVTYIIPLKLNVKYSESDLPFTEFTDENMGLLLERGAEFETFDKNTIAGMVLVGLSLIVNYSYNIDEMKTNLDDIETEYLETLSCFDVNEDNRRELRLMLNFLKKGFKVNSENIKQMTSSFDQISGYITKARENIELFEN